MRAIFLKDTICALGHGIAILQTPPLPAPTRSDMPKKADGDSEDGHAEGEPLSDGPDAS